MRTHFLVIQEYIIVNGGSQRVAKPSYCGEESTCYMYRNVGTSSLESHKPRKNINVGKLLHLTPKYDRLKKKVKFQFKDPMGW